MSSLISRSQRRVAAQFYSQVRYFHNTQNVHLSSETKTSLGESHELKNPLQTVDRGQTLSTSLGASSQPRSKREKWNRNFKPFSSFLTDTFSRQHNYLRISITERCNLRCLYCMPEEGVQLSPDSENLTTPEIVYLSKLFVQQGVTKIRLTGGEPTVRKDIVDLVQQIGGLRSIGLQELCLTTNGIALHRKLDSLIGAGLTNINLSLDTLDPFQYTIMTRRTGFAAVKKAIDKISSLKKAGVPIKFKINCVVMRGLNDHEVVRFAELGKTDDIEIRYIEYMPFGGNKWSQNKMVSFQEIFKMLKQEYPQIHPLTDHVNDTSKSYQIPGFTGRIGFITSMTDHFCSSCNRLRITSDGNLKVCLFGNSEVSLRDILRLSNAGQPIDEQSMKRIESEHNLRHQSDKDKDGAPTEDLESRLLKVIGMAVKRKKEKHADLDQLEKMENRPMILIGG